MSDFLNPKKVLEEVPVFEEMSIADFGCGSGGWVIPLAQKLKDAKIYALDVLKEALSALKSRAEMEKVYNVRTVQCDVERGTDLQTGAMDLVIMSNLLFQVDDEDTTIEEGKRVLRRGGMLLVVDWIVEGNSGEEKLDKEIKNKGFNIIKKINAGDQHFANLYEKI
jgi:ubiquinone/menaquinone biosynthesis C-methylase UbiE